MTKFFAILKDSLRETIDSKVFLVVVILSVFSVGLLATVSFEPNAADEALQKLANDFPDGQMTATLLPVIGKIKAGKALCEYKIQDLSAPSDPRRPWKAEHQFVLRTQDLAPLGFRIAVFKEEIKREAAKERSSAAMKKTRAERLDEEINEEARRIQEREDIQKLEPELRRARFLEELNAFVVKRVGQEVSKMPASELEDFIRKQLEDQGNWTVSEVRALEVPAEERKVKIQFKEPIKEGKDIRIVTKEADGEVHKFSVTVVARAGTERVWPHKATFLFGIPLGFNSDSRKPGERVHYIESSLVGGFGASIIMLLGCIITAFYIPNMLHKGTIDLLLVKPIHRVMLLLYKYVGGLTFMFINTVVLVLGAWLMIGVRTGIWRLAFLSMIFILTFQFALFYAASTLIAVLTRSPIVCILGCVVMWAVLFGIGWAYNGIEVSLGREASNKIFYSWIVPTVDVVHGVLPRYSDLDVLGDNVLYDDLMAPSETERKKRDEKYAAFRWSESILITSLYIAVFLGLSCWRFSVKDY